MRPSPVRYSPVHFTGSYLDRNDAQKHSTDADKAVCKLTTGMEDVYINNDRSGHDLDQFADLTQHMFHYDASLPSHRQDPQLPKLDISLVVARVRHLLSIARTNALADQVGEEVD